MLESCRNAQERWGGVHQLIDRWLGERRELVLAYSALAKAPQAPAINSESLQGFCELLVDYVSAGHFEVYEQLTNEAKAFNDQRGLELAKQIYPRIEAITQVALGAGYSGGTAFGRAFEREFGMSPGRWLKARQRE